MRFIVGKGKGKVDNLGTCALREITAKPVVIQSEFCTVIVGSIKTLFRK